MCGSATHPGRRHHGRHRQERGREAARRLEAREGLSDGREGRRRHHRRRAQRPRRGRAPREGGPEAASCSSGATSSAARGHRGVRAGLPASTVAHAAGPVPALDRRGTSASAARPLVHPDRVRVFAPAPDGRSLTLYGDPARTAAELERSRRRTRRATPRSTTTPRPDRRVLAPLLTLTPPRSTSRRSRELWDLARRRPQVPGLRRKDAFRLLRWGPMAVADSSPSGSRPSCCAPIVAARGIYGTFAGPWSAGTTSNLLLQAALGRRTPPARRRFVHGGMGALTQALAARRARLRRRDPHGRDRRAHRDEGRRGRRRRARDRRGDRGARRRLAADPKRTLLALRRPGRPRPRLPPPDPQLPLAGHDRQGQPRALDGLPEFPALKGAGAAASGSLRAGSTSAPRSTTSSAPTTPPSTATSRRSPTATSRSRPSPTRRSRPRGKHVMSVYVQFAPYKLKRRLEREARGARRRRRRDARRLRAGPQGPDRAPPGADAPRPRGDLRPDGRPLLHGEPALDQLFMMRPLLGWAAYRTPIPGLYLCGAGTHPGGGVTGAPGANASREVQKDLRSR